MKLRGKVVVITGASEGIGAACVREFRERGAHVALTARSAEKLKQVAATGELSIAGDITDPMTRSRVVGEVIAAHGRIDVLVNNAGAGLYAPSHKAPLEEARRMFDLNFFSALALTQLVVPHMKQQRSGCIVNVGSIGGKITLPWFTLYSASKYALGAFTEGLRMELKEAGVHAMLVCPGYVRTGFQKNVLAGKAPDLGPAMRRWSITPEKCARDLVRGVERGARTVVTPRSGWLMIAAARLFPGITDNVLGSTYRKQEARW